MEVRPEPQRQWVGTRTLNGRSLPPSLDRVLWGLEGVEELRRTCLASTLTGSSYLG